MVVKTAPIQYREKSRVSSISLLHGLFTVRVAMEENARAALWTNQVGYITLIAQLPGIYGNVNRPCPLATPSDSGRFTAINPGQLGNNYYIHCKNKKVNLTTKR